MHDLEDLYTDSTSSTLDMNDQVRDVAVDERGHLWFVTYHHAGFAIPGVTTAMFTDWALHTGPPEGPFDVVDTFSYSASLPSFARAVSIHPSGVVFTSGVAMDTGGGTHLLVRAGHPPDMFTSLDDMRDPVLSKPNQGSYARPAAFAKDGTVWVIEGSQNEGATTETGEETHNTRMWRLSCL